MLVYPHRSCIRAVGCQLHFERGQFRQLGMRSARFSISTYLTELPPYTYLLHQMRISGLYSESFESNNINRGDRSFPVYTSTKIRLWLQCNTGEIYAIHK